tara:strand:- start:35 stop:640 length:606 start_codon:yes stop_codon:yes gene_type:complete
MKNIKKCLFLFFPLLIILVSPKILLGSDRSTFPTSRMGGGTRGLCGSRLIMHIVPVENKYTPDKTRLLAMYLGKTKEAKPLTVEIINNSQIEQKFNFEPSGEAFFIFKIQSIENTTLWKSYFNCSDIQSDNMINFMSNISNPVSTLISTESNLEQKKYQRFINKAHNKCGTTITNEEIKNLTSLDEAISSKISENVSIICP